MLKRILSLALVLTFLLTITQMQVLAEDRPMIDGSYLTHEDESIGYHTRITRGTYLLTGYSKGVRLGAGVFYAGGTTIATQVVEDIGIGVIVERAQEGDDHWTVYDTWQLFDVDVDRVASNRRLDVEGGYYYRVRCLHSANGEISSSFTDGVFIEEPSLIP